MFDAFFLPLFVGDEKDFGVAGRAPGVIGAEIRQLGAEPAVVVDLAVEDEPFGAIGVGEGLVAARIRIQDREAAMGEGALWSLRRHFIFMIEINAFTVRSAMRNRGGHFR